MEEVAEQLNLPGTCNTALVKQLATMAVAAADAGDEHSMLVASPVASASLPSLPQPAQPAKSSTSSRGSRGSSSSDSFGNTYAYSYSNSQGFNGIRLIDVPLEELQRPEGGAEWSDVEDDSSDSNEATSAPMQYTATPMTSKFTQLQMSSAWPHKEGPGAAASAARRGSAPGATAPSLRQLLESSLGADGVVIAGLVGRQQDQEDQSQHSNEEQAAQAAAQEEESRESELEYMARLVLEGLQEEASTPVSAPSMVSAELAEALAMSPDPATLAAELPLCPPLLEQVGVLGMDIVHGVTLQCHTGDNLSSTTLGY